MTHQAVTHETVNHETATRETAVPEAATHEAVTREAVVHRAVSGPARPQREIRAQYTDTTITVYQAYAPFIGLPAARDGRFPDTWKRDRMTWIKPSFLWMMYRCGWAAKEGQETVLAVEITREGFDWALARSELSHYASGVHPDHAAWRDSLRRSPARVQWDPERDLRLARLPYRSLQLGLSGEASRRYADEWTVSIRDVTPLARRVHAHVSAGRLDEAAELLPRETPYPGATPWDDALG